MIKTVLKLFKYPIDQTKRKYSMLILKREMSTGNRFKGNGLESWCTGA